MSTFPPQIQCPNPACCQNDNAFGQPVCRHCQTPLIYRYLWAVGRNADRRPVGSQQAGRYAVIGAQIWLDTQPGLPPDVPPDWINTALADTIHPYLRLHLHQLHIPSVYGFCEFDDSNITLLDNAPIDRTGQLFPSLRISWIQASAVRQLYWLWQLLELWTPLQELGFASSLLVDDNIRIEGWRVRLLELYPDQSDDTSETTQPALSLQHLATFWYPLVKQAKPQIASSLQSLCQQMQSGSTGEASLDTIKAQLNRLLLEQAAQQPLHLHMVGGTTTGPQRSHNEDAYYPTEAFSSSPPDPLLPRLAMVCDGIGGHAGGEVASQLALRSLQLQIRALLTEVAEQAEPMPPSVVAQQLEAIVRIVNNMIASQNDTQGREARQRMGTTLVLALQLPQQIATPSGSPNTHELYLVHVGDSRAYWITPHYCHLLTVDDDVTAREVRMGRSLYSEAIRRPDASALTQALGTRDAEGLRATVQRFILEEDGMLLLCSDGLSDNGLVERSWQTIMLPAFDKKASLATTLQSWLALANQKNGHDNTSAVLVHCQVTAEPPRSVEPQATASPTPTMPQSELSEASKALLYDDYGEAHQAEEPKPEPTEPRGNKRSPSFLTVLGTLVLIAALSAAGLLAWQRYAPDSFQRTLNQLTERIGNNGNAP